MRVLLTLKTADGCTGTSILPVLGNHAMTWDRQPDLETVSATFADADDLEDAEELDGDEWRELESSGGVENIGLWCAYGVGLNPAVWSAQQGVDPDGIDGDMLRRLAETQALARELAEYAERYADQNDEPDGGACRAALARAADMLA